MYHNNSPLKTATITLNKIDGVNCDYFPCVNKKCSVVKAEVMYEDNGIPKVYTGDTLSISKIQPNIELIVNLSK